MVINKPRENGERKRERLFFSLKTNKQTFKINLGKPVSEHVAHWDCDLYDIKDIKVRIMFARNMKEEARKEKEREEKEKKRHEKEMEKQKKLQEKELKKQALLLEKERKRGNSGSVLPTHVAQQSDPAMHTRNSSGNLVEQQPEEHHQKEKKKGKGYTQKLDATVWMAPNFPFMLRVSNLQRELMVEKREPNILTKKIFLLLLLHIRIRT